VWAPKKIPNPKYVDDNTIGQYESFAWVGIDIWQVKSGTTFGNLLITDDKAAATAAVEALKPKMAEEKKAKEAADAEKAKKAEEERAKAEEERKAKEAEEAAKKDDAKDDAKDETKKEEL
jgi:calreticulin